jgi:phosphoenolpyruvate carboxylase
VWRELAAFNRRIEMSNTKAAGDVPQVPADPAPAQTPTITHYQQIAENLAKAIDDMLALIPSLVEPHPSTTGFVRTHQNVPIEFIATAIAAVEANPELQGPGSFNVTEARDALQFIDAFRPMKDRLNAAARNLSFSIDTRKANAATGALQVYAVAKGIARAPLSTTVASHVSNLRRDLGKARGGRKKTPTPGTPAPTPAPAPVPTAPIPAVIGGLTAEPRA